MEALANPGLFLESAGIASYISDRMISWGQRRQTEGGWFLHSCLVLTSTGKIFGNFIILVYNLYEETNNACWESMLLIYLETTLSEGETASLLCRTLTLDLCFFWCIFSTDRPVWVQDCIDVWMVSMWCMYMFMFVCCEFQEMSASIPPSGLTIIPHL